MPDTHDDDGSGGPFRDDLRSQLVAAGTAAAEQWLTNRANRKMSDVNRRRLAGHVVNALWAEIERAAVEIAQYIGDDQLAAANVRAEKAEAYARSLTGAVQAAADFSDAVKRIREMPAPDLGAVAAANAAFIAAAADRIAAQAADAPQDGLSATQTDGDDVQASVDGNTSASPPQSPPGPPLDPCLYVVCIDAVPHACVLPKGHGGSCNRVMWYSPDWEAEAKRAAREAERCPCGCPKIGDGCNCHFCNEPYPTRQPDDDTTEGR